MDTIKFLDLTHADLGGGLAVRKPFVVGHLTPSGYEQFLAIAEGQCGFKSARESQITTELAAFESERFGLIRHADALSLEEDDADFYNAEFELRNHQDKARTPGWHPDARDNDNNHMYIVGSADARMNTEYAVGRLRQRRNFVDKFSLKMDLQSPLHPLQQSITRALQASGGIRQIGPGEIVVMPVRTWHRSSPHHPERREPWPFLRMNLHRLALGGDRSR